MKLKNKTNNSIVVNVNIKIKRKWYNNMKE